MLLSGCSSIQWREGSVLSSDKSGTTQAQTEPNDQSRQQVPEQTGSNPPDSMNTQSTQAPAPTPASPPRIERRQLTSPPYPDANQVQDAQVTRISSELARANDLIKRKQLGQAKKLLLDVTKANPTYSGPFYQLGRAQFLSGDYQAAKQSLNKATTLEPKNFYAFNLLGLVNRQMGEFQQAEKSYQQAVTIWPDYATGWYNLGILQDLYFDNLGSAVESYRNYLSIKSSNSRSGLPNAQQDPTMQKVELWIKDLELRLQNSRGS